LSQTATAPPRLYRNRRHQSLVAAALVAITLVSLGVILEPDPETGLRPVPSDYLWVVIPALVMIAYLIWRAFQTCIVTSPDGIEVVRTVGREVVPWAQVRRFEVHPSPSRWGFEVSARLRDERCLRIQAEHPARRGPEAKAAARQRAETLARALQGDRPARSAGDRSAGDSPPVRA
jgi:hypothetical protein